MRLYQLTIVVLIALSAEGAAGFAHGKEHLNFTYRKHLPSKNAQAEIAYKQGLKLATKIGRPVEAQAFFTQAIGLDRSFVDAYLERGLCYMDLFQQEKAISDYTKAIKLDPKNAAAYQRRARAYAELEKLELSLSDYTTAIRLAPDGRSSYVDHAKLCEQFGRFRDAINDYNKYLQFDSGTDQLFLARAKDYERLGQYNSAVADYTLMINKWQDDVAYKRRGDLYKAMKRYNDAIDDYTKALALEPVYAEEIYLSRASAYTALGMKDSARQDTDRALALHREAQPEK